MRDLNEWDRDYVLSKVAEPESSVFERKASTSLNDKTEIAKQVCAFSNAGEGYLVYGVTADGKLDEGVPNKVGKGSREDIKDWIEGLIPKQHHPPIIGCEARFMHFDEHADGRGVLVVRIPLSDRRPHWTVAPEIAYLRVGPHSAPMRQQTFLDLSSRSTAPLAEITDLWVETPFILSGDRMHEGRIRPIVQVTSGPMAMNWGVEVSLRDGLGTLATEGPAEEKKVHQVSPQLVTAMGLEPLFPGRPTHAFKSRVQCQIRLNNLRLDDVLRVSLFVESTVPNHRDFPVHDLQGIPPRPR